MLAEYLNVVAPEVVLAVFAMAALMWGAYAGREVGSSVLWASCVLLVLVGLWVGFQPEGARTAFDGSFVTDGFARFAKVLILFGAAAALAMSHDYLVKAGLMKFEYPVLIVLSVVGMMTMVSARDLIVLYMGLELQSLSLYVVAAFRRDSPALDRGGAEVLRARGAVLGAAALRGEPDLRLRRHHGLRRHRRGDRGGAAGARGWSSGWCSSAAGIAFKVSAVPFHMWTPDVYEGSPTPVTAFFATAPKVAAAAMFARLLFDAFGGRGRGLAADPGAPVGGVDVPRRGGGDRAAQLQAADGLFLDQPHGLRADGPRGGDRAGGAVAADLSRDLRDDERRHLRLHPEHGARRQAGDRHLLARALQPGRAGAGAGAGGAALQPGGGAAAGRASSGSSTC